jgi:hypothetical protein
MLMVLRFESISGTDINTGTSVGDPLGGGLTIGRNERNHITNRIK